jgi:hypothetical protein
MQSENFTEDNFKKWMEQHEDIPSLRRPMRERKGVEVEPIISAKQLARKMRVEEGDLNRLVKEFICDGGIIVDHDEDDVLIEVESGKFLINRHYIEKS